MTYFSIDELCRSAKAEAYRLDNAPTAEVRRNLEALIDNLLDPVRRLYGKPITVNSGYRSPALNRMVGGKPNSQHLRGQAADITTGSPAENRRLFQMLLSTQLPYDQLIDESDYRWLHLSHTRHPRRQVLHL